MASGRMAPATPGSCPSRRDRRAARRAQRRLVVWSVLVVAAALVVAIALVQMARARPVRPGPAGGTVPAVHRIVERSGR
ncbi:MAG: hypothetical protein M0Z93_01310 [Actinomycetota bacterium]|nr:hypothetical protein [Actinomycetota bacterium]